MDIWREFLGSNVAKNETENPNLQQGAPIKACYEHGFQLNLGYECKRSNFDLQVVYCKDESYSHVKVLCLLLMYLLEKIQVNKLDGSEIESQNRTLEMICKI